MTDLAFFYDWLIVDVVFREPRVFDPANGQRCDPVRPTTFVSGGPGRRRWEFMALPGETRDDLDDEATAWRLLEPWGVTPADAVLERHAVYRFQARWADEWRRGRILLAGDAAHQTPPFAGQGMCAGVRDAANLAWKLDLVLGGLAPDSLLDQYPHERAPHVQSVIQLAIDLGKLICVTDPEEARQRDEMFLAGYDGSTSEVPPLPRLAGGIVDLSTAGAGEQLPQPVVVVDGVTRRLDDAVGAGWRLVGTKGMELDPALEGWFTQVGGRVVDLGPGSTVVDVDGTMPAWLAQRGAVAALQRPDFAVYATAASPGDVPGLVAQLRAALEAEQAA